jgi:hypothetical protein
MGKLAALVGGFWFFGNRIVKRCNHSKARPSFREKVVTGPKAVRTLNNIL